MFLHIPSFIRRLCPSHPPCCEIQVNYSHLCPQSRDLEVSIKDRVEQCDGTWFASHSSIEVDDEAGRCNFSGR
jgi:hypothetical protein